MEWELTNQKCGEDNVFLQKSLSCDEVYKGLCQQWLPTYTFIRQSNLWMKCANTFTTTSIQTEKLEVKPILNKRIGRRR